MQVDSTKDLDVLMPIYNVIKYSEYVVIIMWKYQKFCGNVIEINS